MSGDITEREKVLKEIRNALAEKGKKTLPHVDFTSSVFVRKNEELAVVFAKSFKEINGIFVYCQNERELIEQLNGFLNQNSINNLFSYEKILQNLLNKYKIPFQSEPKKFREMAASFTLCECIIARTGSIFFSSAQRGGRTLTVFPPIHIVLAYSHQLVFDIADGIKYICSKYDEKLPSMLSLTTGPSRTADIEKTLVLGAHGPKELIVFFLD